MAYSIQLPDGTRIDGIPDEIDPIQAQRQIRRENPGLNLPDPQPQGPGVLGALKNSFSSFLHESGTGIAAGLGDQAAANKATVEGIAHAQKQADANGPSVMENVASAYNDPKGGLLSAAGTLLKGTPRLLAENAAPLAAMGAGAWGGAQAGALTSPVTGPVGPIVGAILGGAAAAAPQMFASNLQAQGAEQQRQGQPVDVNRTNAGIATAGQVALMEAARGIAIGKSAISALTGIAPEALAANTAKASAAIALNAERTLAKSVGVGAAQGVAVGVPTMVAQTVMTRAQAGQSLTSDDAYHEYALAAAGAVPVMGAMGAVGGVHGRSAARDQMTQIEAVKGQAAQAEQARVKAEQASAEEAKRQDPGYAQDVETRYLAAEQQYKDMLGPKPGKDANTADRLAYETAVEGAKQFHEEVVAPTALEYNSVRDTLNAQKAAQAPVVEAPAAIENGAPQKDLLGQELVEPTPPVPTAGDIETQRDTLTQQVQALSDHMEVQRDVAAKAAQAGNPEEAAPAIRLFRQAEAALADATKQLGELPAAPKQTNLTVQLANAHKALTKAGDLGDIDGIEKATAKIVALKAQGSDLIQPQDQLGLHSKENYQSIDADKQALAGEMADGRAPAAAAREKTDAEVAGIRGLADKAPGYAGEVRQEHIVGNEIKGMEAKRLDTGRTEQRSLLDVAPAQSKVQSGSGGISTRSRAELLADLQIARATGDRTAATHAVEALRDLARRTEVAPAGGETSPITATAGLAQTLAGTRIPGSVAQLASASDAMHTAYARMVDILNRFNKGKAVQGDLDAARQGVLDNLVQEIELGRGKKLSDAERKDVLNEANAHLLDLVNRFGDTRSLVSTGTKEKPFFEPAQSPDGTFSQTGGAGPNVESRAPGRQTFAKPYAAAQTIREGLTDIRNRAIRGTDDANVEHTSTMSGTTPEALRTALDKAAGGTPEQQALLERIRGNLEAVASDPTRRAQIAEWLHKDVALGGESERGAQIKAELDRLELGKRSETEGDKTAIQEDMFPDEALHGKLFDTYPEFEKYLASDALHEARQEVGPVLQTLARAKAQMAPLEAEIAGLRRDIQTQQRVYEHQVNIRGKNTEGALAKYETAVAHLQGVMDGLNAKLAPLEQQMHVAQQRLSKAADKAATISDTIAKNTAKFNRDAEVQAAAAKVAKAYADYATATRKLASSQKGDVTVDQALALTGDIVKAINEHRTVLNAHLQDSQKLSERTILSYLNKDMELALRLQDAQQAVGKLASAASEAHATFESVAKEQRTGAEFKGAFRAEANARGVLTRTKATGDKNVSATADGIIKLDDRRQAAESELGETLDPIRKQAADRTGAGMGETKAQREDRDSALRAKAQKVAGVFANFPGRTISHEVYREALDRLEQAPARITELESKAMDETLPQTTRDKARRQLVELKQQVDLAHGALSNEPETVAHTLAAINAKLEDVLRKRDEKRVAINEAGVAKSTMDSRKRELRALQREAAQLSKLASSFSGRAEVTDILTPADRAAYTDDTKQQRFLETHLTIQGEGSSGRLSARRIGPAVKNTTVAGNIRTGELGTVGERTLAPQNKVTQSGTSRGISGTAAVRRAGKDTASEQAMLKLSHIEDLQEKAEARLETARQSGDEPQIAKFEGYTERLDAAHAAAERELAKVTKTRDDSIPEPDFNRRIDQDGTPLNQQAERALAAGNVPEALRNVRSATDSPIAKRVAQRIESLLDGVRVHIVDEMPGDNPDAPGGVSKSGSDIFLHRTKGMSEETLLHEATHAATLRELQKPEHLLTPDQRKAKQELNALYERYKADPGADNEVAKESLLEFVAESHASRKLQEHLAEQAWEPKVTMWQAVKRWVMQLLGMKPTPGTMLERVLKETESFMRAPVNSADTAVTHLRAKDDLSTAAGRMAAKVYYTPQTYAEKAKSVLGLGAETAMVDARAPVIRATATGDEGKAMQVAIDVRTADKRVANAQAVLLHGAMQWKKDAKGYHFAEAGGSPSPQALFKGIEGLKGKDATAKMTQFDMYLKAIKGERVGVDKLDMGGGLTAAEMREVLDEVRADPVQHKKMEELRAMYGEINAGLINFTAESGAISKAEAKRLLSFKDYVPMYRVNAKGVAELVFDDNHRIKVGDLKSEQYLQALKGGDSAMLPLHDAIVRNVMLLTDMGIRNQARKSIAYAMQDIGKETGQMRIGRGGGPDSPLTIRFHQEPDARTPGDDGQRHIKLDTQGTAAEHIPMDLLAGSIDNTQVALPAFLKSAAWFGDVLRSGVTRNPAYALRQLLADPFTASITAGLDKNPVSAVVSNLAEFGRQMTDTSDSAVSLQKKGVIHFGGFTGDADDMAKFGLNLAGGNKNLLQKVFAKMDTLAMHADAASRSLAYDSALRSGLSEGEAMLASMEMMNFNKRGANPSVQYAARMIPFFNAQIQGLNVLYKAARGQMPLNDQLKVREKFNNRAMGMVGVGLMYAMAMSDDKGYQEAKPMDRYNNWYIPGTSLKIPIQFEPGVLFKVIPEMLVDAMRDKFGDEEMKAVGKVLWGQVPGAGSMGLPQFMHPAMEVAFNKNALTGRDIETPTMQRVATTQRFTDYTTELSKRLSEALQNAPGDTLKLSPVQIEHLTRGYLGSIPLIVAAMANELFSDGHAPNKATPTATDTPFFGRFARNEYGGGPTDDLMAKIKAAEEAKATYSKMLERGDKAKAESYQRDVVSVLQVPLMEAAGQQLAALRKRIKQVNLDPKLSPERKREELNRVKERESELSHTYLNRYSDAIARIAK